MGLELNSALLKVKRNCCKLFQQSAPRMRPRSQAVYVPPELRYLVFPPGFIYRDPTLSSSSRPSRQSKSIIVPHRTSRHPSQSVNIVPHDRFQGVFVADDGKTLYTKNLVPGQAPLYDDEVKISVKENDGTVVEYREWNPFYSKLAAAILCGAQNLWIKPGSRVLVIYSQDDDRFGTTISHISDLVGPQGMVYVVDPVNWKTLASMADKRFNIVPIIQGVVPYKYRMLINMVDVLFAAPDSEEEVRMSYLAATYFLEAAGHYMLYVQAYFIESTNRGDSVFSSLAKQKQIQFKRLEQVTVEPYDKDHAYIMGAFRTLKVDEIEPSCLSYNKRLTAVNSHRGDGEYISLYEQQMNLPVYILFDSSCGYALFRAHKVYSVERNFIAIEEYVNRFDEFFEFRACHPFGSADDALSYLNAVSNGTVHEQLIEFLLLNLPKPMDSGGNVIYSLGVPTAMMANHIVEKTKIACSINLFHDEIIRGVRMHIDRFFSDMKPGDLEKAQIDLARNYCKQKLDSPDYGKSQKKRSRSQASIPSSTPSRKNPKRRCLQMLKPSDCPV